MNTYLYVRANPLSKIDIFGLADLLIWAPRGNQFGHSALRLNDGTYISNWPSGDWTNPIGKPRPANFQKDVAGEGFFPLSTPINNLNEAAIKNWWENKKNSFFYRYNATFSNCSDTVVDALEEGGEDVPYHFINSPTSLFLDYYDPNTTK